MIQTNIPKEKSFIREYYPSIPKKGWILDVGCGLGGNSLFLLEKGFSIEAIDADSKKVQILQKYITQRNLRNIIVAQQQVEQFIFRKEVSILCKNRNKMYTPNFCVFFHRRYYSQNIFLF